MVTYNDRARRSDRLDIEILTPSEQGHNYNVMSRDELHAWHSVDVTTFIEKLTEQNDLSDDVSDAHLD